jgi:3'-5' exoribonuclease
VLHDIGKITELDYARGIKYSVDGRMVGHIAVGMIWVSKTCDELGIEDEIARRILHIIASHHGNKEYGSPVVPSTREALLFHQLDMIDSRMAMVDAAEQLPGDEGDNWTGYIQHLGTPFLRRPRPRQDLHVTPVTEVADVA